MQFHIPVEQGGKGNGMRPMQTLLAALCACSGVDVVKILHKQRQEITSLQITADGEREPGKEPSLWKNIHVQFDVKGLIDPEKANRAVQLSIEKYCSVAETLRRAGAQINWTLTTNGNIYPSDLS